MKIETLKKSHLKRNIIIGVVTILIISAIILNFTRAKYRVTQSIPLVNGTINYSLADLNAVAIYVNGDNGYTKSDTIPESGYVLNKEESYCTVNGEEDTSISVSYDVDTKSLSVTPMTTRGTKCYLYFDEQLCTGEACNTILANKTLATRTDFNNIVTEDTTGTIYYADTSKGRTYYFAGNPTDNWIYFAGFYWRIIRINENGSLRLIYSGNNSSGPVTTGSETQIGTSAFNSLGGNNAYLGYMYTLDQTHGLSASSTIKEDLEDWYYNNVRNYADHIDEDVGFCGDRSSYTDNSGTSSGGGTGKTTTYYGAYIRLITNKTPIFECPNNSDLYTTDRSSQGNQALDYPIGLISADEVAYAGGREGSTNNEYYLYTGEDYWTITPQNGGRYNYPFAVHSNGFLGDRGQTISGNGVRPVINLCADVTIQSGNGTASNPYVVS